MLDGRPTSTTGTGPLAAEAAAARLARPGMVAGREDVIVGGALILAAVMARFGFDECLVSEADILDGLVASQLSPHSSAGRRSPGAAARDSGGGSGREGDLPGHRWGAPVEGRDSLAVDEHQRVQTDRGHRRSPWRNRQAW